METGNTLAVQNAEEIKNVDCTFTSVAGHQYNSALCLWRQAMNCR